jgi:hypothetical protein
LRSAAKNPGHPESLAKQTSRAGSPRIRHGLQPEDGHSNGMIYKESGNKDQTIYQKILPAGASCRVRTDDLLITNEKNTRK